MKNSSLQLLLLSLIFINFSPKANAKPTIEQRHSLDEKLKSLGLPPGLESWVDDPKDIQQVTIAPLFYQTFVCAEHPLGQLHGAGDALGTDCIMVGGIDGDIGFEKMYLKDGKKNTDWYGWHAEIHAPFDGIVKYVHINPVTNTPGTMSRAPASMIMFEREDGMNVVYAHLAEPRVQIGDHVKAGQVVAIDSNNGVARNPHIHVGAYRNGVPYQIRWDLKAMGQVPALVGN